MKNIYSNSEPSFEVLDNLFEEFATVWESVGRQLELEEAMTECIRENNVQYVSPQQKAFEALKVWRQKGTSATYEDQERVLKHLGKGNLAQKYCGVGKGKWQFVYCNVVSNLCGYGTSFREFSCLAGENKFVSGCIVSSYKSVT